MPVMGASFPDGLSSELRRSGGSTWIAARPQSCFGAPFSVSVAYVFAPEGVFETDVHARFIDPVTVAGEDPFTGSAAGCMASHMHAHGLCSGTRIRLEQGQVLTAREPGNWN